jgi:hypothetical protein
VKAKQKKSRYDYVHELDTPLEDQIRESPLSYPIRVNAEVNIETPSSLSSLTAIRAPEPTPPHGNTNPLTAKPHRQKKNHTHSGDGSPVNPAPTARPTVPPTACLYISIQLFQSKTHPLKSSISGSHPSPRHSKKQKQDKQKILEL